MPTLAAEVENLLGGVVLALAFALLTRRSLAAMFSVARAQSAAVAAAAAWQAAAAGSAAMAALALGVLLAGAAALPLVFGRHASEVPEATRSNSAWPAAAVAVAAGLAALALLAMPREGLALALASVLVALLILPARRAPGAQLAGLHALANGVALATVAAGASWAMAAATVGLFGLVWVGAATRPAGVA
jgi:hydrogenase-4 membrane subunit HyfE